MTFLRSFSIPFVLVLTGVAAMACGDDADDAGETTGPDGGGGRFDSGSGTDSGTDGATNNTAPKITTAAALPAIAGGAAAAPVQFAATGTTPITWSISGGVAPPGMNLDATTGAYTGTPATTGTFTFTVTAKNVAGMDSLAFTQMVSSPAADGFVLVADNKLSSVASAFPAGASVPVALTGIVTGDTLVSIDRRPLNGYLYALGFNATAGTVQVYAITPSANLARPVGTPVTYSDALTAGNAIGMDFNPTVDRIRVVTSTGQNFRLNPNNGAAAVADTRDGALNIATVAATGVGETAYTNNVINATTTTQYTISATTSSLYIQNPPNNGDLTVPLVIAPAITSILGFDIAPGINVGTSNMPASGLGIAVIKAAGQTTESLASINLATGALGVLGVLPYNGTKGFTLNKPPATPVIGLVTDGAAPATYTLVRFLDNAPATLATSAAVAGIDGAETLVGIDFRPATGQLYGLGLNVAGGTGTLYRIDPQTGAATVVGAASSIVFDDGFGADGDTFSIDFNPAVDRLRVVSSAGRNFRVHPDTGLAVDADANVAGTQQDASINGGATALDGVAYTNGPPAMGATGVTSEYGLNAATNSLHLFSNPNGGTVGAAIPVRLGGAALDFTAVAAFDIPQSVTTATSNAAPAAGSAYAALNVGGATNLYRIDLVTGAATFVGSIGGGTLQIVGLAAGQ